MRVQQRRSEFPKSSRINRSHPQELERNFRQTGNYTLSAPHHDDPFLGKRKAVSLIVRGDVVRRKAREPFCLCPDERH